LIGLDTNVIIRYIVQDDEQQAKLATDLIESQCSSENPVFINEITLCEIVWVLKRAYGYEKTVIINILRQLLVSRESLFHRILKHGRHFMIMKTAMPIFRIALSSC
jgi:predicted nucleic-acid-binding protein